MKAETLLSSWIKIFLLVIVFFNAKNILLCFYEMGTLGELDYFASRHYSLIVWLNDSANRSMSYNHLVIQDVIQDPRRIRNLLCGVADTIKSRILIIGSLDNCTLESWLVLNLKKNQRSLYIFVNTGYHTKLKFLSIELLFPILLLSHRWSKI